MDEVQEAAIRLAHRIPDAISSMERLTAAIEALERTLRETLEEQLAQEHRRRERGG